MAKKITIEQANRVLKLLGYNDYSVSMVFENGFRATRTNEWFKGEMTVELLTDPREINIDNIFEYVSYAIIKLETYK